MNVAKYRNPALKCTSLGRQFRFHHDIDLKHTAKTSEISAVALVFIFSPLCYYGFMIVDKRAKNSILQHNIVCKEKGV